MKEYIGTKIIQACPMTRGAYNQYRGWMIPSNENPEDAGYLVRYPDGYESWSPAAVFEEAYRETTGLSFGLAIEAAKKGKKIARAGWNGKNQYVELAYCISYKNNAAEVINANHCNIGNKALAFVGTSGVQMGWLASQADMLADDWCIVEQEEKQKPVIKVSGFQHNMQGWYEEKLVMAMKELVGLCDVLRRPGDAPDAGWPSKQEEIDSYLDGAVAYVQTVLKVSTGG